MFNRILGFVAIYINAACIISIIIAAHNAIATAKTVGEIIGVCIISAVIIACAVYAMYFIYNTEKDFHSEWIGNHLSVKEHFIHYIFSSGATYDCADFVTIIKSDCTFYYYNYGTNRLCESQDFADMLAGVYRKHYSAYCNVYLRMVRKHDETIKHAFKLTERYVDSNRCYEIYVYKHTEGWFKKRTDFLCLEIVETDRVRLLQALE